MGDETARQRDALRLAAGHLAGAVALHTLQIEPFEPAPRFLEGPFTACATEQQRQGDVLLGRQLGHELTELEHEAEAITAQPGTLRLPHRVESLAVEVDLAGIRDEDAGEAMEQGGFARSARTHDGDYLASVHGETGAAKRRGLTEGEHKVARLDDHASTLDHG